MYHKVDVFDVTSVMTSMFTVSVYEFTMYDHDVWSFYLQTTDNLLKTHIISLEKLSGKSTHTKKINDTPPHCCNRNDVCRNIKHQQSLPKNEQNTATTKLLLTCYGINKQSRRDAVTTAMVPGP